MFEQTTAQSDKLMRDLRMVVADAEELLRVTADQASGSAGEVRQRIEGRLQQARTQLNQLQDAALSKVKATGHATDEYVHQNPWKSIGAAAGIGLVIGLLIGRR